jgi:hypothetical protein
MSNIVPFKAKNLSAEDASFFDLDEIGDDLSSGITGGFAIVSIRGSKWRIKHQGEETPVLNEDEEPVPSLEVVMLRVSRHVSRIFYKKSFEEGDAEEPDCYSLDGISPAEGVKAKQCDNCATCPQAVWGSKISPAGKKTKACQDNKRMAVVPAGDIANEVNGGPMLLRVPAASLADLAAYGKGLKAKGYPYNAVVTRLSFDMDASYPKLKFKAVRALSADEISAVAQYRSSDVMEAILSSTAEIAATGAAPAPTPAPAAPAQPEPAVDTAFEEEEEEEAPKPVKKKAAAKKKATAKKSAPESATAASDELNDELDDILSDLEGLD